MSPAVTLVATDQLNGVRVAHQRLRALGYHRIGLAVGLHDEEGTDDMHVSGLLLEQPNVADPDWVPPLLFPHGANGDDATPLLKAWIERHQLHAVICNWTNIRSMIRTAGFRIPEEVACACICLSRKNPSLAGVVSNMGVVGQRVSTLLATLLRTERRGVPDLATHTFVQGKWYDGSSAPLCR